MTSRIFPVFLVAAVTFVVPIALSYGADKPQVPWHHPPETEGPASQTPKESSSNYHGIEATVINPYQSANVCSQVAGMIKSVEFQEGDFIDKDKVVVRLDDGRYRDVVDKTKAKLSALELELEKAEQDRATEERIFEQKVSTRQQVTKIKTEAEILTARIMETHKELDLAERDLAA